MERSWTRTGELLSYLVELGKQLCVVPLLYYPFICCSFIQLWFCITLLVLIAIYLVICCSWPFLHPSKHCCEFF